MGLLDDLKKQADALKAQDTDRTESLRANAVAVDHALRRAFLPGKAGHAHQSRQQLDLSGIPTPGFSSRA